MHSLKSLVRSKCKRKFTTININVPITIYISEFSRASGCGVLQRFLHCKDGYARHPASKKCLFIVQKLFAYFAILLISFHYSELSQKKQYILITAEVKGQPSMLKKGSRIKKMLALRKNMKLLETNPLEERTFFFKINQTCGGALLNPLILIYIM